MTNYCSVTCRPFHSSPALLTSHYKQASSPDGGRTESPNITGGTRQLLAMKKFLDHLQIQPG